MESPTPMFTAGQEIATSLVSCGLLPKAWEASCLANESESESYRLNEYEGVAYVAFPSFHNIERFDVKGSKYEGSKYGEGNIQTDNIFSDGLKGNHDQPARVHQGSLKQFLHIMMNTDFKAKLQKYTDWKAKKLKPIIFVGHSLGGAVATLATLWVLEKRLRKSCPFCITFGCPLVGDERLVQAVGRENWAGNFCHLISKNDIVPRMLLAPFELIANSLTDIFLYWKGIMPYSFIQNDCKTLLENVLKYTSTIANYGTTDKGSPYRPFGTCMFCSSRGAVCIENSEAVLKMLHWTLESQEKSSNNDALACISEHTNYGLILDHLRQNSENEIRIENCDSASSYNMGISLQLEAIGLGAQNYHAKIALQKAGKIENKHNTNVAELMIGLVKAQSYMAEIEWYKESCKKKNGYYDCLKDQIDMKDYAANLFREKLAGIWDLIIKMWGRHELPSDFQSQNKWINAGNAYRRLVEPLDISDYYRKCKGNGNYLSNGRPDRHQVLQKWKQEKDKTRRSGSQAPRTMFASLTEDSCFWARVEEALKDLKNLKEGQQQRLESLQEFEDNVTKMITYSSISSDVFLEGSSFMKWWEGWVEFNKNHYQHPEWRSTLYEIMPTVTSKILNGDVL